MGTKKERKKKWTTIKGDPASTSASKTVNRETVSNLIQFLSLSLSQREFTKIADSN